MPQQDTTNYTVPFMSAPRFWVDFERSRDMGAENPFPEMFDIASSLQSCSCGPGDPEAPSGTTPNTLTMKCYSKDYEQRTFFNSKANCEAMGMKLAKFDTEDSFNQVCMK
jgi:hypothetical protein